LLPDRQRSENDPEKSLQIEKISETRLEDQKNIKELKKVINELIKNSMFKEEKIKDLKKRIKELEKRSLPLDDLIMFFKNSEYLNDICQRKDVETIGKLISHLGGDVVMMRLLEIRRWNIWFFLTRSEKVQEVQKLFHEDEKFQSWVKRNEESLKSFKNFLRGDGRFFRPFSMDIGEVINGFLSNSSR
jgi:exonuclease VII small subunit